MVDLAGYSEPQAARILSVSARTLQRWRLDGRIGFQRSPGGRVRYTVDQLIAFQANCRVTPKS